MPTAQCLALTTCPHEAARTLAESILKEQLAACVSIVPGMQSLYRWKGVIEEGQESLLLIKTSRVCYPRLEQHIRASHPYELPEIVMVNIAAGYADYLAWIGDNCRPA